MAERKSIKKITYCDDSGDTTSILVEEVLNAAYGCYVWPSALVMGEFVWHYRKEFALKTVLEVGAGTSIPSLVLAKSSQVAHLILSDIPDIIPVVKDCLSLNQITNKNIWINAIEWGSFGTENSIDTLIAKLDHKMDYILGSDTFYEPSRNVDQIAHAVFHVADFVVEFENLLVLVSYVIQHHNPSCKFFTTYQERSPKRSIQYLLDKWKLKCRLIPKEAFDFDETKYMDDQENTQSQVKVHAGTLSSVFLLEISSSNLM